MSKRESVVFGICVALLESCTTGGDKSVWGVNRGEEVEKKTGLQEQREE